LPPSGTRPSVTSGANIGRTASPDSAGTATDIRSFARGGSLAVAGLAVGALLQFLIVVVITRGLDTGSAGTLLETIAFFTILSSMGTLGADIGVVRDLPVLVASGRAVDVRRLLAVACYPVAAIGIVFAAVSFAGASSLAAVLFDPSHSHDGTTYLRIVAPAVPLAALTTVALAATRGLGTMVPYVAVQNLVIPAVRVLLVVAAVAAGLAGAKIAAAWTLPVAAGALAAFVALRRLVLRVELQAVSPARERSSRIGAARFWRFAAPRGVASIFEITVLMLDVLLVGALRSTNEAAVYAAASRLVIFGSFLLFAVSRPLAPQFSKLLARGENRAAGALYHIATWWGMVVAWPLYITCAIFAVPIMSLFGFGYSTGSTALLILSLAYLFDLGTGNMNVLLLMSGKSTWNLANAALALGLNVGLNFALIPPLGIEGAAIAWAASVVAYNLAAIVEIRALLGLGPLNSVYPLVVAAPILSYGAIGAAARLIIGNSVGGLIVACALGTLVYSMFLWRWREALRLQDLAAAIKPSPRAA
jgi:O-antigen/teichoic acid export membrane protein